MPDRYHAQAATLNLRLNMSSPGSSELLAQAHALSETLATREGDARWAVISVLHDRREPLVFDTCSRWAVSRHAFERVLQSEDVGSLEVEAARDLASPELLDALESLRSWWDVDSALLEEATARSRA
ncbi:MAG: hypothetical protein NW204_05440 [Xanthomonadaceae bacterium]|nr:hypothetical protein [Xanthomonadaceae bacterium]